MSLAKQLFVVGLVLVVILSLGLVGGSVQAGKKDHGRTIVFTTPVRAVVFEHQKHIGHGMVCDSCHPNLFVQETGLVEKKGDFNMASFAQGKYCGSCHNGRNAFAANTRCTVCHIGVAGHKRLEINYLEKAGSKSIKKPKPE